MSENCENTKFILYRNLLEHISSSSSCSIYNSQRFSGLQFFWKFMETRELREHENYFP